MNILLRRLLFLSLLLTGFAVFAWRTTHGAVDPVADEATKRKSYSDAIRQSYSYPFEKGNIALPGNASAVGNDFLEPGAFPDAAYCGHCHQQAYHQWRQSLHSNSFRTPFYRTSVNILLRTKGIEFARHCDSCHNPVGILTGALDPGSTIDRSFDRDGLTCMTCHSVQKRAIDPNLEMEAT